MGAQAITRQIFGYPIPAYLSAPVIRMTTRPGQKSGGSPIFRRIRAARPGPIDSANAARARRLAGNRGPSIVSSEALISCKGPRSTSLRAATRTPSEDGLARRRSVGAPLAEFARRRSHPASRTPNGTVTFLAQGGLPPHLILLARGGASQNGSLNQRREQDDPICSQRARAPCRHPRSSIFATVAGDLASNRYVSALFAMSATIRHRGSFPSAPACASSRAKPFDPSRDDSRTRATDRRSVTRVG